MEPPPLAAPPQRRPRVASAAAWTALVAAALWTAGAVDPAAGALLAGFLLVHALVAPVAARDDVPASARWAVLAALAACAVQLVPLPEALRALVAPGPASARSDLRALGLQGSWAPITVDVGRTVTEAVYWGGAAALLAIVSRRDGPPFGARLAIGLLVALHGVAWLLWAGGLRVLPLTSIADPWGVGQAGLRETFAGWLINRNHWAALGLVLWPLAALFALRPGPRLGRALAGVGAALVVASVVATRSRAGLGALALQAVGLVLFAAWRARGAVRWVALAAVVAAAVAGRGVLARYLERFSSGDVVARGDVYRATARMAADSPAVGWGMGTFEASFPAYQPDSALYHYAHAHCDPLEWVAGGGALGLALVVALAARGVVGARDRRASAWARALWFSAVAGCAAAACVEFPLQIPAVRFVWLGVLFAGPPRDRADVAPGSLPTAR